MLVLITIGALAVASPASAACRLFGTQLECDLGANRVLLGTQRAHEPTYAGSFMPQAFRGTDNLLVIGRALPDSFQLQLQDIGADPSLCRKIGNETYCY